MYICVYVVHMYIYKLPKLSEEVKENLSEPIVYKHKNMIK